MDNNNIKTIFFVSIGIPSQFKNIINTLTKYKKYKIFTFSHLFHEGELKQHKENIVSVHNIPFFPDNPIKNSLSFSHVLMQSKFQKEKTYPDLILCHVGTGIEISLNVIFPDVPIIGLFEWYFKHDNNSFELSNAENLSRCILPKEFFNKCSLCITPTMYQKSQFPNEYKKKIFVIHEGINCNFFKPIEENYLHMIEKEEKNKNKIYTITYLSRGLESIRYFLEFIQIIKTLLLQRDDLLIKIVGHDGCYYEPQLKDGPTYQDKAMNILGEKLLKKVQFLGKITDPKQVVEFFQESDLHIYISKNFVPSWSLLEAMSCGCIVLSTENIGSEFIKEGVNGFLTILSPFNEKEAENQLKKISQELEQIENKLETILQHDDLNNKNNISKEKNDLELKKTQAQKTIDAINQNTVSFTNDKNNICSKINQILELSENEKFTIKRNARDTIFKNYNENVNEEKWKTLVDGFI